MRKRSLSSVALATTLLGSQIFGSPTLAADSASLSESFDLAQRYEHGEGLSRDPDMAFSHYCIAAQGGHAEAAYSIAWMYLNGRGLSMNEAKAGYWLKIAADAGDEHASSLLNRLGLANETVDGNCPMPETQLAESKQETLADESAAQTVASDEQPKVNDEALMTAELEGAASTAAAAAVGEQAEATSRAATQLVATSCYEVGPLDQAQAFAEVSDWLTSRAINSKSFRRPHSYGRIYQVYTRPDADRAQARKTANRYRQMGLSDLHVIGTGVLLNGISMGAFRVESQARERVAELAKVGIKASFREQNPTHYRRWVRFSADGTQINAIRGEFPRLEIAPAECERSAGLLTASLS